MTSIFTAAAYAPAAQQIQRPGASADATPPGQAREEAGASSAAPNGAGLPVATGQVTQATGANPAPAATPTGASAQSATTFAAAVNGRGDPVAPEDIARAAGQGYRDAAGTMAGGEIGKLLITA